MLFITIVVRRCLSLCTVWYKAYWNLPFKLTSNADVKGLLANLRNTGFLFKLVDVRNKEGVLELRINCKGKGYKF